MSEHGAHRVAQVDCLARTPFVFESLADGRVIVSPQRYHSKLVYTAEHVCWMSEFARTFWASSNLAVWDVGTEGQGVEHVTFLRASLFLECWRVRLSRESYGT